MKIYKIRDVLQELEICINEKLPFSHIRFGDGGIKFIHSILTNDDKQLKLICKKEGIPYNKVHDVFLLWGYYARQANFIDTPEVYFSGKFWDRMRKPGKPLTQKTYDRMVMWKELYSRAEFYNVRFCNPESNYLMILSLAHKNILDIMRNKRVCIITAKPEIKDVLSDYDIDIMPIVSQYNNQYHNSFSRVTKRIKRTAAIYDFWLVAAGELGRIYSGLIKDCGGRTLDIGFVIEYWLGERLHPRLRLFMEPDEDNHLQLLLTKDYGMLYKDFI